MGKRGQALYFGITKAVVLKQLKRQDANGAPCFSCPAFFHQAGETCAYFANMLHHRRMRFGAVCDTDFEWAKHRQLSSMSSIRSFEKDLFDSSDSLWLVPKKVDAHNLNLRRYETIFQKSVVTLQFSPVH